VSSRTAPSKAATSSAAKVEARLCWSCSSALSRQLRTEASSAMTASARVAGDDSRAVTSERASICASA